MKRILFLSYPFPPNFSAGAIRSERFARHLSGLGWKVDVISPRPSDYGLRDLTRLESFQNHVEVHHTNTLDPWLWLKGHEFKSLPLRVTRSALMRVFSFPDHMLMWVPFAVLAALETFRQKQIDAIYTTSPPHTSHIAGLILAHITGKPWLSDFRDPWTLNAYRSSGTFERATFFIERTLEKAVLYRASRILVNTLTNQTKLLSAFPGVAPEKVIFLPNGWEEFPPSRIPENSDAPLSIVHAGTFYPRFQPYGLLHALAHWREKKGYGDLPDPGNVQVLLLGANDSETKRVIADLKLEDMVSIIPRVGLADARHVMAQADVLWTSLGTGKEAASYIPSKLFEYIAARRPIFGFFPEGEAANLIRSTRTGIVFTNNDPQPVIEAITRAIMDKKHGVNTHTPNQEIVEEYNFRHIARKLAGILDDLTARGGRHQ